MTWLASNLKLVVGTVLVTLLFAFGFATGALTVKSRWDSEKLAMMEEASLMAEALAKRIQELEIKGAKDEETIRGYRKRNPSGGLHLPPPTCPGNPGAGGVVQDPPRDQSLSDRTQQAVNRYTEGVDALMLEADLIVNDCRVVFEWAKSLKK